MPRTLLRKQAEERRALDAASPYIYIGRVRPSCRAPVRLIHQFVQPIPRGLGFRPCTRSAGLPTYRCDDCAAFPVSQWRSSALLRNTVTRSCRMRACFPFHRTGGIQTDTERSYYAPHHRRFDAAALLVRRQLIGKWIKQTNNKSQGTAISIWCRLRKVTHKKIDNFYITQI